MAKKFLIVDDSASIRQLICFALKDAGCEALVADSGKDALSALNTVKVDMIFTDLNMPAMDGIELISKIRSLSDYKFTPIIMLTTEAQEEKKQLGKQAGASGWIIKPFSAEQILKVVRKFLGDPTS